jgi:hypothetical protein
MQVSRKIDDAGWFVVPALPEKVHAEPQPITLGDRIMKLLKISKWSDLLVEGDEPYFSF